MKVTNSNKKTQTITITGTASEMVFMLNLAERMAMIVYNKTTGVEKETHAEIVEQCDKIGRSITNGNYFC